MSDTDTDYSLLNCQTNIFIFAAIDQFLHILGSLCGSAGRTGSAKNSGNIWVSIRKKY
jgi:hypothetical protein